MILRTEHRELLRRLTLNDEQALNEVLTDRGSGRQELLDDRSRALVKFAGLITLSAEIASLQVARDAAWAAGVRDVELVDTVVAVAPIVGTIKMASIIPRLAIAMETTQPLGS